MESLFVLVLMVLTKWYNLTINNSFQANFVHNNTTKMRLGLRMTSRVQNNKIEQLMLQFYNGLAPVTSSVIE